VRGCTIRASQQLKAESSKFVEKADSINADSGLWRGQTGVRRTGFGKQYAKGV
jgi:hypothetical protein